MNLCFYGKFARFAKWLLCAFSPKYHCDLAPTDQPVVYVCRHLNMHGPFTTMKWLPCHVHPFVLHVYFDRKKTVRHMTQYTFSVRQGKKPKNFCLRAHVMSWIAPPIMHSMQAIAVYRSSAQSLSTLKSGLKYLLKGESLIVYPDIDYTGHYGSPSDIYDGFLMLGAMYRKKTGKSLSFIPLVIDDRRRTITAGDPVFADHFRRDRAAAAACLKMAINDLDGQILPAPGPTV